MRIHHDKHHQAYIDKLNGVLSKYPSIQSTSIEELLKNIKKLDMDEADKIILRNNGGGHVNHMFFWSIMDPKKIPDGELIKKINHTYMSVEVFRNEFTKAALNHFGSGWVWLVENKKKNLELYSTPNQDSPFLSGHTPLLGLDIWEHAYYLKYQNRKSEYVQNWWNIMRII